MLENIAIILERSNQKNEAFWMRKWKDCPKLFVHFQQKLLKLLAAEKEKKFHNSVEWNKFVLTGKSVWNIMGEAIKT